MCLDIYSQHICTHINHRQILLCGRLIEPACHQVVVMEEANPCFNCLHPPLEDIPQLPEPALVPVPNFAMANSRQPYVHYLDYNAPPQVIHVGIPAGGQGPIHVLPPGGLAYPGPPPPVQAQQQAPNNQGWIHYPGFGTIAAHLPPPIPGVPYYPYPLPHPAIQQGYAYPHPQAPPPVVQQGYVYPHPQVPPPVVQQNIYAQPQAQPPAVQQDTRRQPFLLPVEIRPTTEGQPPLYLIVAGSNQVRLPALPAQAARENVFYVDQNPFVRVRNPHGTQPLELLPAPPGTLPNPPPPIEAQAAEAGAPLVPPAANYAPELRWLLFRDETWRPVVHYLPLGAAPPAPGMGRQHGYNPLHGWDTGALPPGWDVQHPDLPLVSSREDFPFVEENEEEIGNGEGSSGWRVEVESVQARDEDEVSSQAQSPQDQDQDQLQLQPQSQSQPASFQPKPEPQPEPQILNNFTEPAIDTPPPTSSHPASHHQPTPSHQIQHQKPKIKKRVRFIFPAREDSVSPPPCLSVPATAPNSPTSGLESPVEVEGIEVAGIVYVNAQTQTLPRSCLSRNAERAARRVRFDLPAEEERGVSGGDVEIGNLSIGDENENREGVVYVDAETQTLGGVVFSSLALPEVLPVDAKDCSERIGKKKEEIIE